MHSEVKPLISSLTAFTISLGSLPTSTVGAGKQSTMVGNSVTRYGKILVSVSIKLGTSPTAGRTILIYAIRSNNDGTPIRNDLAGPSDANWTRKNADYLYTAGGQPSVIYCGAAATGDVFTGLYELNNPGNEFGIGVVHDTGVNLDSTGGNHICKWQGLNPEIQVP
jgi:hypothetical protein